jgi:CDP-glycerol glycerophosphotransferase (TagB/SpsB family)
MTGLPRHDLLLSDCGSPDAVVFAPTWRRYLFDPQRDSGHEPERIKQARESCAVMEWNELMHHRPLLDLCERKGLRIVLAMHPNLAPIAEAFDVPSGVVALADFMDGRYATALSHCAALVTDYSSISFDAALLNRPVVYLHPDGQAFFGGGHTVARGYFDYEHDGFGPVVETGERAAAVLARELTGPPDPVYSGRRAAAFAYRDGQNCQRVADVLAEMTA